MLKTKWFCALLVWLVADISGQELNIIPHILHPYIRNVDELVTINVMANISEKIFNFKKMGFKFGEPKKNKFMGRTNL